MKNEERLNRWKSESEKDIIKFRKSWKKSIERAKVNMDKINNVDEFINEVKGI